MIIKIRPDKERVKSMLRLIENREEIIASGTLGRFPTFLAESYYEVIKELAICILLLDGFKSIGENAHKEALEYLQKYKEFSEDELFLMNDLRIRRNKSSYEGKMIDESFIENHEMKLKMIIKKLKRILND